MELMQREIEELKGLKSQLLHKDTLIYKLQKKVKDVS